MELYLYAKRQIENVKGPRDWKVDMMKFEECENLSRAACQNVLPLHREQPDYFSVQTKTEK